MKRFLTVLMIVLFAFSLSIASGNMAPVAKGANADANFVYAGLAKTLYATVKLDSMFGATTKTILSKFIPEGGFEYILARDTLSSPVARRTGLTCQVNLIARDTGTTTSNIIGKAIIDTIADATAPQQIIIPFQSKLVGESYDILLQTYTSTDSIYFNHFYLLKRKSALSSTPKTSTGMFGN